MQAPGHPAADGRYPATVMTAPAPRPLSSATPPFAALPTAPGMARGHVNAALAGWGLSEFTDAAALIAREMVANAVAASAPVQAGADMLVIRVCLITNGDVLTIECWDQAPGVPVLREPAALAESGRGLAIIDNLTGGTWGCQPAIGQAGKCVWAEIPLCDAPARRLLALAQAMTRTSPPRTPARCTTPAPRDQGPSPLTPKGGRRRPSRNTRDLKEPP